MKTANRKLDLILEDGSGGFMTYQEMISELKDLRNDLMSRGSVRMRSLIPMVAQNAQKIGLAIADRGDLYPTPLTKDIRLARENKNAGKRIDLYNLLKMYKQLNGDAGKVNVDFIKRLDHEELDEEIRRFRDFIADIQYFEPLIKKYEEEQARLDEISFTERKLNDKALQLQDIEDRLMGRRTRMASDVIYELEDRVARLERVSARGLDKRLQEEIIEMIEQEFEDDLSGMSINFKAMSKAKSKSGKEYTLYEVAEDYYAITDGKDGYWMISEDKREAEKEMSDLKRKYS